MATIRIQSEIEKRNGIVYQFESTDHPIGEGGMGKVYKGVCVNERTGVRRPIAIKFMFDDLPPSAYERARREAEIRLRNDNLVEMLGFVETQECTPTGEVIRHYHVVSELLTGVSLADILQGKTKDRDGQEVPFAVKMLQDYRNDPEHFARTVVMNVLSGLMALHDAGYIHRDIDPSNIMVTTDGHIKLIDYGIAKQMNSLTTGDKALTVAGKFMGKPEYAAPELVLGDIGHQNQTTDIYAVGILLYQCIIGHTPFEGPRHEILEKQLKSKLPLGSIKNKELRKIIATACDKKQELRFRTSAQMRVALENVGTAPTNSQPNKKVLIGGVSVAAAIALLVIVMVFSGGDKSDERATEITQMEQVSNKALSNVEKKITEAQKMYISGEAKTDENSYEKNFMQAYTTILEAEAEAKKCDAPTDVLHKISIQKTKIMQALDNTASTLVNQAKVLSDNDEQELATIYYNRAKDIENFRNNK